MNIKQNIIPVPFVDIDTKKYTDIKYLPADDITYNSNTF